MELPKLYPQYPNRRNLMDYKQTWYKVVYNNLIINIVRRILGQCRSSYKVFSDLLRKQYSKQQNNGP